MLTRELCQLCLSRNRPSSEYYSWLTSLIESNILSLERERNEFTPLTTNLQRDQCGGRGRPKHHASPDQLQALNEDAGFSWSEIAITLGISERTLRRRSYELGMSVEGRVFSNLSDNELDDYVRQILTVAPGGRPGDGPKRIKAEGWCSPVTKWELKMFSPEHQVDEIKIQNYHMMLILD